MQVVLCLILVGSIGLAQWVVHDRETHGLVRLGSMRTFFEDLGVRLPAGWALESQSNKLVKVQEPAPGGVDDDANDNLNAGNGRTLLIRERKVRVGMQPEDFLGQSSLRLNFSPESEPIQIGSLTGVLVSNRVRADTEMAPESGPWQTEWIAGCVGPDGTAVAISLRCPNEPTSEIEADKQLLRNIAASVVLHHNSGD